MTRLSAVSRVVVPRAAVARAHLHLRSVGERGAEGFALWIGATAHDGTTFRVRETVIPAQTAVRTDRGVCVMVDGAELHRLNLWLYAQRMTLIAQLHSHPGEAYHSPTDDALPIATAAGSISLVVPDFARAPFVLERCAVYRLAADGRWIGLDAAQVRALITIEG